MGNCQDRGVRESSFSFMFGLIESGDKVPVSFNFCNTTKTPQLLRYIKDVLAAIKEARFTVAATVYDQSRPNQSDVETLVRETIKLKGEDFVLTSAY